jgi:hypothetical protein
MILTAPNGSKINVDRKKITEMGPHTDGGSFIKIGAHRYIVTEQIEEILAQHDG